MTQTSEILLTAIQAVAEACSVTRTVQAELSRIQKMTKDDRSPVTVADFAAQAIVCRRLTNDLGDIDLVGEESADDLRESTKMPLVEAIRSAVASVHPDVDNDTVLSAIDLGNHDASSSAYWTLDPVDGTKGFLRGGQYAVSLAYIDDGIVTLGVLGCPNISADFKHPFDQADEIGSIFYATLDGGAWYLPANQTAIDPTPIRANQDVDLGALTVCESVEASHSKQDDTARILQYLDATSAPARLDSQCKYAVVGRGQADAYLRLPTRAGYQEKIWDHAAGKLVAEEAGAIVSDIHGKPLDFSHGTSLTANKGVICTAPAIHRRILEAVEALGIGG